AYRAAGFSVADVGAAFKSSDTSMTALAPYGKVPENVVQVCQHTWMCAAHPFGPDDHPNKSGYMIIAQTILDSATGQS
ncbi:MAG: hypothetical protein KGJ36_06635, partial [Acidobacteriota bacterium]|nr:hypothetical protein [Acidobacteriota bacterium]